MKRFLSILLCLTLLFGLTACGGNSAPADTGAKSETATAPAGTDSGSSGTSGTSDGGNESGKTSGGYDPDAEHLVLYGYSGGKMAVLDLNAAGDISDLKNLEDGEIWVWDPDTATDLKYPQYAGAAGMKFRHSAYWDKDVILLAQSNGWVGIIDYETKAVLFEDKLPSGPHCAEMMPNGDLVIASSGNGDEHIAGLYYYPLSQGATEYSDFTNFLGAHGVCYDPENDCLWALGDNEVRMYTVSGYGTANAKCQWVQGEGASLAALEDIGGHNLTPVYGQPGKYWVTSIKGMWQFDTKTGELTNSYKNAKDISYPNIKGMCYFPDGTIVQSGYVGEGGNPEYCSTALRIITMEMSGGKVSRLTPRTVEIPFGEAGAQIYKVQPFIKDYQ